MINNVPKQIILLSTFTMLLLGTGSTCIRKQVKKELKKRLPDPQAASLSNVSSIEAAKTNMEATKSEKTPTLEKTEIKTLTEKEGEEKLDKIIAALSNKNISEEEIEAMIKRTIDVLQEAQDQQDAKRSIPQSASQRRFYDYHPKEDLSPSSPPLLYETMAENPYYTATPGRDQTRKNSTDYHHKEYLLHASPPPPYEATAKNPYYTTAPDIRDPLRNRAYGLVMKLKNALKYRKYSKYEHATLQNKLNEANAAVSKLTTKLFLLETEQEEIEKRNTEIQQLVKTPAPSKHIKLQQEADKSCKKDRKRILQDIESIKDKIKIKQIKIGYLKRYLSKVDSKSD